MKQEPDHQSCKDDKKESCTLKPVVDGGDSSSRCDRSQPAPLCNKICPCKQVES